jgi:2'-5' RNA ligase
MRLFIAIDVPDAVRSWVIRVRRAVEARRPAAARGLRWVAPEQGHVTLRFLGDTDPTLADRLREALGQPIGLVPFELRLSRLAWLPGAGRPRVLIAEIGEGLASVRALRTAVDLAVKRATGLEADARELLPHLTLARVRERDAPAVASARREVLEAPGDPLPAGVRIEHVTLYESELLPDGPRHTPLARARLTPGGAA